MYSRHDLVWLDAAGWRQAGAALLDGGSGDTGGSGSVSIGGSTSDSISRNIGDQPARPAPGFDADLALWRRRDWPLVVRRREPGLPAGMLSVGLPLPPAADGSKRRIACNIAMDRIARHAAPLLLATAIKAAPLAWQAPLQALLADNARAAGAPTLQVFGSLAMQALTGQSYLGPASDIDLLLVPRSAPALHAGLALLLRHADAVPLDGEIVFPGGAAVAWREWAGSAAGAPGQRVLVKGLEGVQLAPRASLLATLEPA